MLIMTMVVQWLKKAENFPRSWRSVFSLASSMIFVLNGNKKKTSTDRCWLLLSVMARVCTNIHKYCYPQYPPIILKTTGSHSRSCYSYDYIWSLSPSIHIPNHLSASFVQCSVCRLYHHRIIVVPIHKHCQTHDVAVDDDVLMMLMIIPHLVLTLWTFSNEWRVTCATRIHSIYHQFYFCLFLYICVMDFFFVFFSGWCHISFNV